MKNYVKELSDYNNAIIEFIRKNKIFVEYENVDYYYKECVEEEVLGYIQYDMGSRPIELIVKMNRDENSCRTDVANIKSFNGMSLYANREMYYHRKDFEYALRRYNNILSEDAYKISKVVYFGKNGAKDKVINLMEEKTNE